MKLKSNAGAGRLTVTLAAVAVTAIFILVAQAIAGCGGGGGGADTGTAAQPGVQTAATTLLPAPESASGQTRPQELAAAYGPASKHSQSVGMLIDGLQLQEIRWSDQGSFFRVVFDMVTPGGKPLLQAPHAQAALSPDGKFIKVALGGVRSLGESARVRANELKVGNALVTTIDRLPGSDDQTLVYGIYISRPSAFALAGIGSPGRIVIDIIK